MQFLNYAIYSNTSILCLFSTFKKLFVKLVFVLLFLKFVFKNNYLNIFFLIIKKLF